MMNYNGLDDATAILRCLEFLAQEAGCLDLPETLSAIVHALETATRESGTAIQPPHPVQPQTLLH